MSDTGASALPTGLGGAEAPEPRSRLGPSDAIPSAVWVVVRSTGEYSDRVETPIRFCLTEEEAKRAVELTSIEAQRDAGLKPPYRREYAYGYRLGDGTWLPDNLGILDPRRDGARFEQKPNAAAIEQQNEAWEAEYDAACRALGHVDPAGSWSGDEYYYAEVTLWPPR